MCCRVLQCFAVFGSVLQCVAACCSVLQCVAVCCSVLQCVAVCCSVLQCVAVRCSALQCVAQWRGHSAVKIDREIRKSLQASTCERARETTQGQETPGCTHATTPPKEFLQHTATLQHTASHCNSLEKNLPTLTLLLHQKSLCNTLQHTAAHGNTRQHMATYCNTVKRNLPALMLLLHQKSLSNTQRHTTTHWRQTCLHSRCYSTPRSPAAHYSLLRSLTPPHPSIHGKVWGFACMHVYVWGGDSTPE